MFRIVESSQCIRADYLAGQTEILPKMRAVLIDWLVQRTALHCTDYSLLLTVTTTPRRWECTSSSTCCRRLSTPLLPSWTGRYIYQVNFFILTFTLANLYSLTLAHLIH